MTKIEEIIAQIKEERRAAADAWLKCQDANERDKLKAEVYKHDYLWSLVEKHRVHPCVAQLLERHRPVDAMAMVLEWPHVAETDPSRLAYTRNLEHGQQDRQTVTSIGTYLKRHWPDLPDHVLRDAQAAFTPDRCEIGEGIEYLICAAELGPRSCMQSTGGNLPFEEEDHDQLKLWLTDSSEQVAWEKHPYAVYRPEYGWKMAVRYSGGQLDGRCLLLDDGHRKVFVRSYARGENERSYTDHKLETWLTAQGYEKRNCWPEEVKLAVLDHPDRCGMHLLPYIDGQGDQDRKLSLKEGYFEIDSDSGNYLCDNTDGTATVSELERCEDCNCLEDSEETCALADGRCVCRECYGNYIWADSADGRQQAPTGNVTAVYSSYSAYRRGIELSYVVDDNPPDDYIHIDAQGVYATLDAAVCCTDGDWHFHDDPDVVRLRTEYPCTGKSYSMVQDAWMDSSGSWYSNSKPWVKVEGAKELESDCWQCAGTGTWYLNSDAPIVMASGEEIHESFFDRVSSDAEWGDSDMEEVRQYQISDEALPSVVVYKGTGVGASLAPTLATLVTAATENLEQLLATAQAMLGGSRDWYDQNFTSSEVSEFICNETNF